MKAIGTIDKTNKGEMGITTLPICLPKAGEILIKVYAAGVNRADLYQKAGKYPPPAGASDILGLEVAGTVEKIGDNASGFAIGDKVCALIEGGGYAEYAIAHAQQTLPIPNNLNFYEAASIVESAFTVWSNLFDYGHLKKGGKLLVHGGASGIGVMAIQIAHNLGIDCYATAGSDEKCEFITKLGAKKAINYKKDSFVEALKSDGIRVDMVLDMVGGDYFDKNISVLAKGGRLVSIGFLGSPVAEVNFAPLLVKNINIIGTTLRDKSPEFKSKISKKLQEIIWPMIEKQQIKPIIDSVFDLEDFEKAHKKMQSNSNIGKIILRVLA